MRRVLPLALVIIVAAFALPRGHAPTAAADASAEQPIPISTSWPLGIRRFLTVETSPTVFNVLYHWGEVRASADGAYGPNASALRSAWYVEYQRAGNVDVTAGVLHRNAAMVAEGLKMFHFALAREASDGSFPGSTWPFHGTAMFLAESVPSLIVLQYSPMRDQFRSELSWEAPRLRRAAAHLVRVVHGVGKIDDRTKNHRFYEAAMALGSVGVLTGDSRLIRWSRTYAREAIRMERPNGVMPEDGGNDTGYQALGMMHATRYLELVANGTLRDALYRALAKGEAWELSRVRKDGTIDQTGDTRTRGCAERNPTGQCKTTFYEPIFNALARWSVIAGDTRYQRAAYAVWLQNWKLVPGDVLPPPGLWASPATVAKGQWLTVWGTRFQPLEVVHVYVGTTEVATEQTDQTGSFGGHSPQPNAHFPVQVDPGRYLVTARGSYGTVRRTSVTVTG